MAETGVDIGPAPLPSWDSSSFDSHPLFMKSLPEDIADDPTLSALQSLVHEGSPDGAKEVARNFKEQGNDYFKGKRYREAIGFYTQGMDAKPTNPALREALLTNRAACNFELQNYGRVLRDCSLALSLNVASQKAYYRSALALLALDRLEEALDCCDRCLKISGDNNAIKALKDKIATLKEKEEKKLALGAERKMEEERLAVLMDEALERRNIFQVPAPPNAAITEVYQPHFSGEHGMSMVFPFLLHYPQHGVTEVVAQFHETDSFSDHLDFMFPPHAAPPDWDKKLEYVSDGRLVIYMVTRRRRLLKVERDVALEDVFKMAAGDYRGGGAKDRDGLEMSKGYLNAIIVLKGPVEDKWVREFNKHKIRATP